MVFLEATFHGPAFSPHPCLSLRHRFVAVGRGTDASGKDVNAVSRGISQTEVDEQAFAQLKQSGATRNQKIVYRCFSHGGESGPGD
jgi:hypothetical protein